MAKPSDIYGTNRPNLLPRETKFASTSQQDWTPMLLDRRFFFNDTATTEIYTLSLHDALPIFPRGRSRGQPLCRRHRKQPRAQGDRKSTRLNSSHVKNSYAVFCLKKTKNN